MIAPAYPGKDNTGVTDRVVNQLLTLIDGADATMGGMLSDDEGDDGEGGQGGDGGGSNQVHIFCHLILLLIVLILFTRSTS